MPTSERKSVVITGAAGGMGRAASQRLAANGWDVLAVDRDGDGLAWAEEVEHVTGHAADISREADNREMIARAESLFGGLQAIILNAGITGSGKIDQMPFALFEQVIAVNLFGAVHGIRAALPLLRRNRESAIVVTSSTMGLGGDTGNWAYGASKHALVGLVQSLSRELGCDGVRINALCPGLTRDTGMTAGMEDIPETFDALAGNVPLGRWAEADEMAAVMEFLVSSAASYINGVALPVDGGTISGTGLLPPERR